MSIAPEAPQATAEISKNTKSSSNRSRTARYWWARIATIAAVILALQLPRFWEAKRHNAPAASGAIRSIAVLPLMNLNSAAEHDYFADGLTDDLITNLAQIRALRVISRTSVMHYKDTRKLLREIRQELKVDVIVEGAVQQSGTRFRASLKLIDVAMEQNLWVEVYEGDLHDIFSREHEMVSAITQKLGVPVTAQEWTQLSRSRHLDPDAYEAYLKGRFFWNARSADGLQKAVRYFEQSAGKRGQLPLGIRGSGRLLQRDEFLHGH
jgi:TolB-like protein